MGQSAPLHRLERPVLPSPQPPPIYRKMGDVVCGGGQNQKKAYQLKVAVGPKRSTSASGNIRSDPAVPCKKSLGGSPQEVTRRYAVRSHSVVRCKKLMSGSLQEVTRRYTV